MIKKAKNFFIILFLFFTFLLINITSYSKDVKQGLAENFFRLHIIANSNSPIDQELKLKVRDSILEYINEEIPNNLSKDEVILEVQNKLADIKLIAESTIKSYGFNYDINLEINNFYFPTKNYYNLSLPAGYYDALKVSIGNAQGENWWCSLFPPLCFIDMSSGKITEDSKNNLKSSLSNEEFEIINKSNPSIKLKFKFLELF